MREGNKKRCWTHRFRVGSKTRWLHICDVKGEAVFFLSSFEVTMAIHKTLLVPCRRVYKPRYTVWRLHVCQNVNDSTREIYTCTSKLTLRYI